MFPSNKTLCIAVISLSLSVCSPFLTAQAQSDFSGSWQLDIEHSIPARSGDVTLKIVQRNPEFIVETTILRAGRAKQHAVQRYTTDGKPSTSIGADGDSFVSRVEWKEGALVFAIVEHEDGRTIESSETWSMMDDGKTLKRVRQSSKSKDLQTLLYTRRP